MTLQGHIETATCTPVAAVQDLIGEKPKTRKRAAPFGLNALWLHFANEIEIRRLAKLHMRIKRKKVILSDLILQRQKIMNRCIRRMRRAGGKN